MGRPKGAKNKSTLAAEAAAAQEFVYEDSDQLYQQVMSTGAVGPEVPGASEFDAPAQVVDYSFPAAELQYVPTPVPTPAVSMIYLVEGKVRLDQDGSPPVFSDQRRIVNAGSVDEALQKFMHYFTSMSNPLQRYTVVQAGASETIL